MSRRARSRLATTILVVVAVVFAQLALAQFVCPVAQAAEAPATAMEMDMAMTPGVPCGMEHEEDSQPALCHHHCTNAAQSFEPLKLPTLTLPAVVQVIVVPLKVDATLKQAVAFEATGEAQPPPSPVFLSTLRLRV